MDTKKFKYKSSFASPLTKITNPELDKYISLAGLDNLKPLIPKGLDLDKNIDLIGAALNAAVAGRVNLNDDSVTNEMGVQIAKSFLYKFVDSNHNRNRIIGTIVNTGFSEFGSNKILTEEEALKSKDPINISLAILLYKLVLPDEYINLIEGSADPSSADYGRLSASWEILFNDYDIAVGSKNISEAKVYSSEEDKAELDQYLKVNGGSGKKDGEHVYRVIKGDICIGTGIGLVEHPAASVKGLVLASTEDKDDKTLATCKEKFKDSPTPSFSGFPNTNKNSLSQINNQTVNKEDKSIDKKTHMKISKITDITEESLKQAAAADFREFIENELRAKSDEWAAEKGKKDKEITEANQKYETLAKEHEALKASLSQIEIELNKFKAEKDAQAKQEKFNQRMASFDETYELDNEDREAIAKSVKALATDEQFAEYEQSLAKLLRNKNKALIAEAKQAAEKAQAEAKAKEGQKTQEALASAEEALDKAKKDKTEVPNAGEPGTPTLREKYAKAFDESGFEITFGRKKNKN